MPKFGKSSRARRDTCDPRIQRVFNRVIQTFDHSILCGEREREAQEKAFSEGRSKARFGQSKHNTSPSLAIDAAPWPIDWNDIKRFTLFAGYVLATADAIAAEDAAAAGLAAPTWRLRWGGDWDSDRDLADNRFNDLPHFEIEELIEAAARAAA